MTPITSARRPILGVPATASKVAACIEQVDAVVASTAREYAASAAARGASEADIARAFAIGAMHGALAHSDPGFDQGWVEWLFGKALAAVWEMPAGPPSAPPPYWSSWLQADGTECENCAHQGALCGDHH